jgi:DNA-binding LacI/PurR family transcriptional regulator
MAGKKSSLLNRVVEQIRTEAQTSLGSHLPTLGDLARRYRVSLHTISRAVHVLRDEGLLEVAQGRAASIRRPGLGDRDDGESAGWESKSHRLYRTIRRAIESGTYRSGGALPKIKYFTVTERVTERTVSDALKTLEKHNLIHKHGKRWVVGPPTADSGRPSGEEEKGLSSPVILIVVPDYERWRDFFKEHLRVFVAEFLAGLRHHDVQFLVVHAEETDTSFPRLPYAGRRHIAAAITNLGNRYHGAFLPSEHRVFPEIQDWVNWLLQFGRPVMWFDYDDSIPMLDRRVIDNERYFRLYCSIDDAVEAALRTLAGLGHTRVGVAQHGPYGDDPWSAKRVEAIRRMGARLYPSLTIDIGHSRERLWDDYDSLVRMDRIDDILFRHAGMLEQRLKAQHPEMSPNRRRREVRAALIEAVPSLASLVTGGCTAILALNQFMGVNTLTWLTYVGIDVPADMSILSFDNIYPLINVPISTVDFGFGNLGYQAAHVFIGDIPVRADKWGNIGSRPQLLSRGSLGPPRKRHLRLAR